MSSVSSTGSDYSYYQQQVSDLEDQNAKDRKKASEREDERVSNLERAYHEQVRRDDEESARALSRAKESSNSALATEHENNKAELARLKRDTYDRYGRLSRDNSAERRKDTDELQNALEHSERNARENLRSTRETYGRELARRNRVGEENTRRALDDARESYGRQRESASASERRDREGFASESAKRYDDLNRERLGQLNNERRLAEDALEQKDRDSSRRIDATQQAYESRTAGQERQLRDNLSDHANRLRASHRKETDELREKMGDLIEGEKQYVKSWAQGRHDAVHELENDWRRRFDTQGSSYERQIADLQAQNHRTEQSLSHQNYENMRDKDDLLANTLKESNQAHHQAMQGLEKTYSRDLAQLEAARKHDNAVHERRFESRMAGQAAETSRAMGEQARAMRESALRQRQSDREDLTRAENALHEQRTSANTALISPAAEASMRRQIAGQYEKTAQADQARNQRDADRLREEYRQQFMEAQDAQRLKDAKTSREIASERDDERARYATHLADLQEAKEASAREQNERSERDTDKLVKNYARVIGHQNQEHEQQLDEARGEASSQLDALRDERSFERRMAIRESNDKRNQMAHDYEKKLADQRTQYEDRLANQKIAFDSQSHEKERQYRNTLDQQGRAYEHKLAQTDAQFQERERFLSQTYQDQIDRLKRSNQLLIQRRS